MKARKLRSFEKDQGYSWYSQILGMTMTLPRLFMLPRVTITFLGAGLFVLGIVFLLVSYTVLRFEILRLASWLLLFGSVLGSFFAGDNGRRFVHFLFPVTTLRKMGIPTSERPVSRTVVRVAAYTLFAFEISLWIWWQVFTAPPIPTIAEGGDKLLWLLALRTQATDQAILYWWLLPVLYVSVLGLLRMLEGAPMVGWILRLTRLVPLIIPLIGVLEALMIYRWWDFTFQPAAF